MRRILAVSALSFGLAMPWAPAASAAPDCDIAQNCPCLVVASVVYKATGHQLYCA